MSCRDVSVSVSRGRNGTRRRSAEEASILSKGSMGTQGSLDELSQLEPILVKVLHRHARPSF